ncbi:unnamed protein product, partial [Urochloa humidicola]
EIRNAAHQKQIDEGQDFVSAAKSPNPPLRPDFVSSTSLFSSPATSRLDPPTPARGTATPLLGRPDRRRSKVHQLRLLGNMQNDKADIVDEAITFFRANVFFKNFHVKSPADKLLIYLTFYINIALKRLEGCRTLAVGTKAIINLGLEKVPVPGEPGFPFPGLFTLPVSQEEAELLRNYLKQIREETSGRLLSCAYRANGFPNKWWLAFAKRKFMNIVIL